MAAERMKQLDWDSAIEGAESPEIRVENVSRINFVRYAGASGDFNPIHYDDDFTKAAGNETIFGQGMFTAGVLGRLVSDWLGMERLRRYRVRFTQRLWPGDDIICRGRVVRRYEEDGERRVDVQVVALNQKGEVLITGDATAVC